MHDGTAFICEDGVRYSVGENEVLFLEPGKPHYGFANSEEYVSFSWIHYKTDSSRYKSLPKYMSVSQPYILKNLFSQCLHTANTPSYNRVCCDLYTALIAEEILTTAEDDALNKKHLPLQIKEWVRLNMEKDITVSDVAKHFGYHENHVSRIFKSAYNTGLKEYITYLRIENSKNLLTTTLYSGKQIARMLSFKSENHFLKFFKYHMKMTPSEYRNSYVNTHINKQ